MRCCGRRGAGRRIGVAGRSTRFPRQQVPAEAHCACVSHLNFHGPQRPLSGAPGPVLRLIAIQHVARSAPATPAPISPGEVCARRAISPGDHAIDKPTGERARCICLGLHLARQWYRLADLPVPAPKTILRREEQKPRKPERQDDRTGGQEDKNRGRPTPEKRTRQFHANPTACHHRPCPSSPLPAGATASP